MVNLESISKEKYPITKKGELNTFIPFFRVNIQNGEVLLDKRDEVFLKFFK